MSGADDRGRILAQHWYREFAFLRSQIGNLARVLDTSPAVTPETCPLQWEHLKLLDACDICGYDPIKQDW